MKIDEQDEDIKNFRILSIGYAVIRNPNYIWNKNDRSEEYFYVHRIIAERMLGRSLENYEKVDHINGDKSDNRRINLRVVTHKDNIDNRTKLNKNNTSGVRGVYFRKDVQKRPWAAQYAHLGKHVSLGSYATIEEAEMAIQNYRADNVAGSPEYYKKNV
jgi:hypothetical protein